MAKTVLCMLLTCFCYLVSVELCRRKERLSDSARDLSDCVGKAISMLGFLRSDVYKISKEAFGACFKSFDFDKTAPFPELWAKACESEFSDPETKRLALTAGEILGSSDAWSQAERLRILQEDIRLHAESMRQKYDSEKRIYKTVGAFSGLALSIMII